MLLSKLQCSECNTDFYGANAMARFKSQLEVSSAWKFSCFGKLSKLNKVSASF